MYHHEQEVGELKLNLTKLEKAHLEASNKDKTVLEEKEKSIEKLTKELGDKQQKIETIEGEIKTHQKVLSEVKTQMVNNDVTAEYFCSECKFEDSDGKSRDTCG